MLKKPVVFLILLLIVSCDSNSVFSSYESLDSKWEGRTSVDFTFQAPDTIQPYNLFINVRNNEKYPFSNLFLIVNMEFPNGNAVTDTLEYQMTKPDGSWLGEGFTSLKENKLWYKENVIFPVSGEYEIRIEHAMRINGKVDGVKILEGVKDVGVKIEKAVKQ